MTPPGEVQTGAGEKATPANRDEIYGARLFVSDAAQALSDVRLACLLTGYAYELVITKAFGIPQEKQTIRVKLVMTSALAAVVAGYAARLPRIRPSGIDTAMGASVLNSALRGIAGGPSRNVPAAGVMVALAVLFPTIRHAIRSTATRASHDVHTAVHAAEARYGHPATSVAADRTSRP